MNKILVLIGSFGLIAAMVWWFFAKPKGEAVASTGDDKMQSVEIVVDGGYLPRTVTLKKGVPATLVFLRKDPSGCLEEVVMPDFGVAEKLPVNKSHEIVIKPDTVGEFKYTCGMQMFSGTVVVE
jgi:plastocyanin domain-containing protein